MRGNHGQRPAPKAHPVKLVTQVEGVKNPQVTWPRC